MDTHTVTSKGQITIPKDIRQKLGIRQGSAISFVLKDDHLELQVISTPAAVTESGFGLVKSKRHAVPADFDPATLLQAP